MSLIEAIILVIWVNLIFIVGGYAAYKQNKDFYEEAMPCYFPLWVILNLIAMATIMFNYKN